MTDRTCHDGKACQQHDKAVCLHACAARAQAPALALVGAFTRTLEVIGREHARDWQPIETAPRSADPILTFNEGGRFAIETGHWVNNLLEEAKETGETCWFTHWMPLPAPPALAPKEAP